MHKIKYIENCLIKKKMSHIPKILICVSIFVILGLVVFLTKKKLEFESRTNSLFLKMIANFSSTLDKIDSDFDNIFSNIRNAKNKLNQLPLGQREKLTICDYLRNKYNKQILRKNVTKEST